MNTFRSPTPVLNTVVNRMNSAMNTAVNSAATATNMKPGLITKGIYVGLGILVITAVVLVGIYWSAIQLFFEDSYNSILNYFSPKKETPPPPPTQVAPPPPVVTPPPPPKPAESVQKEVECNLPQRRQVFNISQNRYTYYDAEPLCKALGAELATYDQIKDAYEKGADWCNYGWIQGQMAVYPTQESSWLKLQAGPEEQRRSCGKPGINGGFFDNPELRFGVTCYGVKPQAKASDLAAQKSNAITPLTPQMIEFDQKVSKFKSQVDTIGITPWSGSKWSE